MRNRVDVVAPTMAGVVRYAGGWMFDLVMAGWDVAVDAELYRSDAGVRRVVQEAVGRLTEVRLWGEECPVDLDRETGPVSHRLSFAAQAFKAQALAAVAAPVDAMDITEMFSSARCGGGPPGAPPPIPAGRSKPSDRRRARSEFSARPET